MANTNKATGLTPVKYLNGSPWTGGGNIYHLDSGDGNAIYVGDPVALAAGTETVSGEAAGLQSITVAVAGATCVGVVVAIGTNARGGPYINPSDLTALYAPATKTKPYFAFVVDDPMVVFEIQEGGTGTLLTVAATSKNANFALAAPSTGVSVSATYLDNGTAPDTSNTKNLKLLGLAQKLDQGSGVYNTYGKYAKWWCLLNNHSYKVGVAGI